MCWIHVAMHMRHVRNKFLPVVTSSLNLWKLFASTLITSSDESVGGKVVVLFAKCIVIGVTLCHPSD
jgi:hypothetical protein